MPYLTGKEIEDIVGLDLNRLRFIPGAPPGVHAFRLAPPAGEVLNCEGCGLDITRSGLDIWCCDRELLGTGQGLAYWHFNCLEPGPVTVGLAIKEVQ